MTGFLSDIHSITKKKGKKRGGKGGEIHRAEKDVFRRPESA
jgi:hypothetical protein